MRCSALLAAAAVAGVTAAADAPTTNATAIVDNPPGVTYAAALSGNAVDGTVSAVAHPDGAGVVFTVRFTHLPATGGPFPYHIHQNAVPANGNCTATGGHLDPFGRGEAPPCDVAQPQTCQVGDLSGKHGTLALGSNGTAFQATYVDLYASTNPAHASFFGNRSIVVHAANLTRLACGSFARVAAGNASSPSASAPSSPSPSSSPSGPPSGSGAAAFVGGGGGGAGRVAGLVVALTVAVVAVL